MAENECEMDFLLDSFALSSLPCLLFLVRALSAVCFSCSSCPAFDVVSTYQLLGVGLVHRTTAAQAARTGGG